MREKIVTEFLHDVVRKQNLDTYMRNNNNDWDNFVSPTQDPWSDVGLTDLAMDWMRAVREQRQATDMTGGPF
jgi:hypothetical protein